MTVFLPLNESLFSVLSLVCQLRLSLDRLNSVHGTLFPMTFSGIIYRLVKQNQQTSQVHDWIVCKLGSILRSVGHRIKIHKITPATGKERGDIEINDYVVLMTHIRFGRSHLHPMGQ